MDTDVSAEPGVRASQADELLRRGLEQAIPKLNCTFSHGRVEINRPVKIEPPR